MRNPFLSLSSLPSLNLPLFTRSAGDLESAAAHSRPLRKRGPSHTRSTSHSQPISLSTGATSYASAFRTPLPVLSRTETICLEGVSVREQAGVVYVEAPVSPGVQAHTKGRRHASLGFGCESVACGVDSSNAARGGAVDGGDEDVIQERAIKMRALLEKYDPGLGLGSPMWPMDDHRDMVGQMLLDGILVAAGKLRKHSWVMGSKNERYRGLCSDDRWDTIHEDLMRYTKALKAYEAWHRFTIRDREFGPSTLPRCGNYGRTLAVIECASRSSDPEEVELAQDLSQSLMHSHAAWWRSDPFSRHILESSEHTKMMQTSLGSRIALATFGGMALIFPMLIMVLDQSLTSRLVTTCIFTFAVAWMLAYWMVDASHSSLVAMAAAYAAVLVGFIAGGEY